MNDENPYGVNCPVCGKPAIRACRCRGPHDMIQLMRGHGFRCKNGHRFNGEGLSINFQSPSTPSQDMIQFFIKRTDDHINAVRSNLQFLATRLPQYKKQLDDKGWSHDQSKFKEPLLIPYIWITWMYKCKKDGIPFKMPEGMEAKANEATKKHCLFESHHPEYYAGEAPISMSNRDKSIVAIDATSMTPLAIIEMVCDWKAVGDEKGNKAFDWYKRNVPSRWIFNEKQCQLIEEILHILE